MFYTIYVIALLANGHFEGGHETFTSLERCQGYREAVIVAAAKREDVTLVSGCTDPQSPVTINMFFKAQAQAPEPKP
jgi:hypothetical protein